MSIGGRFSKEIPGSTYRLGPAQEIGLAKSLKNGSVKIVFPLILIRKVAWPNQLIRSPSIEFRSCMDSSSERLCPSGTFGVNIEPQTRRR